VSAIIGSLGFVAVPYSGIAQGPPTAEEQRAREAEQTQEAQRASEAERQREAARTDRRYERDQPGELYVAGFGGYTIGHGFDDVEGTGALSGLNLGDIDLKDSGVYGAKVGYFMPRRLNWLGVEMEAFNTTPHLEQTSIAGTTLPGAHLRVTTLAFNAIARAKMMCERHDNDHDRTGRPANDRDYRYHDFCRLQPYVGVGLGVFFARASDAAGSSSDNGVPGLNALAGIRYYFTERVALFGEYKYNRATFDFDNVGATAAGIKGDYSASHIVGGLSLHF
jgi:opacity protein-like surface antigen